MTVLSFKCSHKQTIKYIKYVIVRLHVNTHNYFAGVECFRGELGIS